MFLRMHLRTGKVFRPDLQLSAGLMGQPVHLTSFDEEEVQIGVAYQP